MSDGYWKTKVGRIMLIQDMDDKHLRNSINMIHRGIDVYGDPVSSRTKAKLPDLEAEFNRRKYRLEYTGPEVKIDMPKINDDRKKYDYVDVRFAQTPAKIYTYRVRKGSKCFLGQQLVVSNETGTVIVFVVGINVSGKIGSADITEKVVKL